MASGTNSDLYRWKRWTRNQPAANPAPSSSTKKPSHKNEVKDWIKKVELASDQAAAATFGLQQPRRHDYTYDGHSAAMATLDVLQDHNEAYTEAQDLLSQWMAEKINLDGDDDSALFHDDDKDDDDHVTISSRKQPHKSELQNQWETMLEDNEPGLVDPYNRVTSEELFHQIETRDDDSVVENIIQGMLNKEFVRETFKTDLGLDSDEKKKKKDPRVTMDARQRRVKENREKRQLEKEKQLKQRQSKKDSQLQARQMVLKEEKHKALQKQREEAMIQQEMAKIRKEMQDQRHTVEETKKRQQQIEDEERERIHLEEEKKAAKEAETRRLAERLLEQEGEELVQRAQQLKAEKAGEDLKILQRHFQAWYQLVIRHRLRMGKARAVSDWRCLVRSWNAWRAYVRACQAERDTKEAEMFVKETHRKRQMTETHNRRRILRKYFMAWQSWITSKQQLETLHDNQEKTKSKMAAFLEAAASGKLWTNRNEDTMEGPAESSKRERSGHRSASDAQNNVDDLFAQPAQRQKSSSSIHSTTSSTARSNSSQESNSGRSSQRWRPGAPPPKPKDAWQISRKHVQNLTAEEIASIGEPTDTAPNRNHNNSTAPSMDSSRSEVSVGSDYSSSKKTIHYRVNNFEHRYAAQQKLLHDQQQQLREQQRLIQEMQDNQKQAMLKMELKAIQGGEGVGSLAGTSPRSVVDGDSAIATARSEPESSIAPSTARSDDSQTTANSDATNRSNLAGKKAPTLKGMDERAARRDKLKAEREERQRKKEEEKLAKIREEEERKLAEEEAEKKARIERRKEEKRLVKQREEAKQQRIQQVAEQHALAEEHHRHALMRNYGLKPWKRLLQTTRRNMDVAVDHHSMVLLGRCLLPWHRYTQDVKRGKVQVAEDQYHDMIARRCFNSWKKFGHYQSILLQKARRHYALTVKVKIFSTWQDFVINERLERYNREELATQHNTRRIMKVAFHGLRHYPKMLKAEKDREKRREEMRKKVASMIPDFGGFS